MDNNNKTFNANDFLESIGLGFNVQTVERPEEKQNVFSIKRETLHDMDVNDYAIEVHIKNLINTYGADKVYEIVEFIKMMRGE